MRPLQLSFSGMRSYTGRCGPLDFTGKNLIGILGDTGAGKSTILEAITFALYGSPSWSNRDVAPLVASDATAMTVDFTFEHEGHRWRVRRTFHVGTTPTSHLLANLDTKETYDNAGPVNRKIESLLNMNFNSFQAAVLLPQGRFDRLLTATGRDRTDLLKGIFGTQVIETMQSRATECRERLTDLLNEAQLARRDLLDDPASEAQAAGIAAKQAERKSARLTEALEDLRDTQREAIAVRDHREELTRMLGELDRHGIDATQTIDKVRPAARHLAEATEELAARKQVATNRLDEVKAQLEEAKAQEETLTSLSSADTVLSGVQDRLAALADQRDELAQEDQRLLDEAAHLMEIDTKLTEARTAAVQQDATSLAAAETLVQARDSVRLLRDATGTALGEAVTIARSLREADAAERSVESCRHAHSASKTAVEEAKSALESAQEQLEAVRRNEAAHLLGANLSDGDPCPVCARPLPGDYHAPDALDLQELQASQHAKEAKAGEYNRATKALSQAEAKLIAARETAVQRRQVTEESRSRLEQARKAVMQIAHSDDAWPRTEIPAWDRSVFTTALQTEITTLSEHELEEGDGRRAKILVKLLEPAEAFEQALAESEGAARTAAITAKNRVENFERSLHDLQKSHEQATRRVSTAKQRYTAAEKSLRSDLDNLPDIAQRALPVDRLKLSAQDITEARRLVSKRQEELNALVLDQDETQADLTEVAKQERILDQRHHVEVVKPLQSLLTGMERWVEVIQDAAQMIGHPHARGAVPQDPTVETASQYADVVTQSAAKLQQTLHIALKGVSARAEELVAKLMTQASALGDADNETAAGIAPPHDVKILDAAFLDPLKDAATTARNEAARRRAEQAEAESQIERAHTLDAAIGAGQARHAAVDKLRSLLSEAKFQQYLIDQRTLALLGLASDIFGQLSDNQFGFGPDFQIVSRASNTSRSPKTLSGGETFLASLALALALVELYGRTGTRLGALFLDEGFGSLDVDTLARALAVLRSETGGDKLVAVISHLHAVAEAVEDVLWVERRPAGSAARWLNSHERDALVREDVSTGLLRLA